MTLSSRPTSNSRGYEDYLVTNDDVVEEDNEDVDTLTLDDDADVEDSVLDDLEDDVLDDGTTVLDVVVVGVDRPRVEALGTQRIVSRGGKGKVRVGIVPRRRGRRRSNKSHSFNNWTVPRTSTAKALSNSLTMRSAGKKRI